MINKIGFSGMEFRELYNLRMINALQRFCAMKQRREAISEYKGMWLFVLFDLPVKTKKAKKDYSHFRKKLLQDGFSMLQFSIYARYYSCEESSQTERKKIREIVPTNGHVRLLTVTDKQFGKMQNFFGKYEEKTEQPPPQLMLF